MSNGTAVVTGAAVGIGRQIAQRLAEDGFHVVCVDVQDGTETVASIEEAGGEATFREGDVTDERSMRDALSPFDIDVLVNNAAIYAPLADDKRRFDDLDGDEWDDVMEVNVKGVWIASKEALPNFTEGGAIVNIASNTAITGVTGFLHYVASKGAVMSMTRAMANELGEDLGIRVNAVLPGLTMSDASLQTGDEYIENVVSKQALDRRIQPENIADAVAFLSGADSALVSGQMLTVDGGLANY